MGSRRRMSGPAVRQKRPPKLWTWVASCFERNRNENLVLSLVASAILGGLGATMLADRTAREKAVGGGYVPGVQP